MIARVLASVLIAAVCAPVRVAAPAPALHEIDASANPATLCANVVVHANAAILATLRDDAALKAAIARLRDGDYETPGSLRQAAIADLARTSNDVAQGSERAKAETQRLRDYAIHPAGADRSTEIGAFVNPLDAALVLQRKAADDLAAFAAALHRRDSTDGARQYAAFRNMNPDDPDTFHTGERPPSALSAASAVSIDAGPSPALSAKARASDLEALTAEIGAAETRAAPHGEPAAGGC